MECRKRREDHASGRACASLPGRIGKAGWGHALACAAIAVAVAGAQTNIQPGGTLRLDRSELPTAVNQPPDSNAQMEQHDRQEAQKSFAAANAERRKQIAEDSAKLLKLAADLKTEVDKTTKDTLSLTVIRKADEIEKLARSVKEKMKLTAAN